MSKRALMRLVNRVDVHMGPKVGPADECSLALVAFIWFVICLYCDDFNVKEACFTY